MHLPLSATEHYREEATAVLREELRAFSFDGLVQLREDLAKGCVARGSWKGCVFSYRRGSAASATRDAAGRTRNAFTILWDSGWITDEEVAALVRVEIARRSDAERAGRMDEEDAQRAAGAASAVD